MSTIRLALERLHSRRSLDGYCLFLLGIVLRELEMKEEAKAVLLESVHETPLLWCAWHALLHLHETLHAVVALTLPAHWMADFFRALYHLEFNDFTNAHALFLELLERFPRSAYLQTQLAVVKYHQQGRFLALSGIPEIS